MAVMQRGADGVGVTSVIICPVVAFHVKSSLLEQVWCMGRSCYRMNNTFSAE